MLVRHGFFSRGIAEAGWVQDQLTGFPHLTKPIFDVSGEFLAVNQTPVDARPFCRAAFRNIKRWLEGTPPPAGRYIDGALRGTTFVITRDEEGNATGGVRAPHMPSIDAHGNVAGAPLGSYNGVDNTDPANVFRLLAGVFTPFTQSQLDARYPASGPNDIKHRVKRAARQLFEDDLILRQDLDGYKTIPITVHPAAPSSLLLSQPIVEGRALRQKAFWIERTRVSKPPSQGFYSKLNEHLALNSGQMASPERDSAAARAGDLPRGF